MDDVEQVEFLISEYGLFRAVAKLIDDEDLHLKVLQRCQTELKRSRVRRAAEVLNDYAKGNVLLEFRGRHGLACHLRGCRCAAGTRKYQEALDIFERAIEVGEYSQVAEEYGITRERIRQIVNIVAPGFNIVSVRQERAEKQHEQEKQKIKFNCEACNTVVYRMNGRTCGDQRCQDAIEKLRYHVDENRREMQKKRNAYWAIANLQNRNEIQIRHARRILSGEAEDKGRWFIEGSGPMNAAVHAYEHQGAIFFRLPEELQQQVAEYVERTR